MYRSLTPSINPRSTYSSKTRYSFQLNQQSPMSAKSKRFRNPLMIRQACLNPLLDFNNTQNRNSKTITQKFGLNQPKYLFLQIDISNSIYELENEFIQKSMPKSKVKKRLLIKKEQQNCLDTLDLQNNLIISESVFAHRYFKNSKRQTSKSIQNN